MGQDSLGAAGAGMILQDGTAGFGGDPGGGAGGTASLGGAGPGMSADGGGPDTGLPDAAFADDGDAGPLPPCAGGGSFAEPVVLAGLPSPPLFGPSPSADGRPVFFAASVELYSRLPAGRALQTL